MEKMQMICRVTSSQYLMYARRSNVSKLLSKKAANMQTSNISTVLPIVTDFPAHVNSHNKCFFHKMSQRA